MPTKRKLKQLKQERRGWKRFTKRLERQQQHHKQVQYGKLRAASDVRVIDPQTGEVVKVIKTTKREPYHRTKPYVAREPSWQLGDRDPRPQRWRP